MERPVYIGQDLFEAIQQRVGQLSDQALSTAMQKAGYEVPGDASREELIAAILARPSRFAYRECDILSRPDLLSGVFIEFDDEELDTGHTYLINREAAEEIAGNEATVLLRTSGEGALVPRARIERAFAQGCVIDFREHNPEKP